MRCAGSAFIREIMRRMNAVACGERMEALWRKVESNSNSEWTVLQMNRTGKGANFRPGSRPELNPNLKDMVATRGMELRRECKTLRAATEIINEEFGETLAISTVSKWIHERIKPELEETADQYRQHLLEQIAEAKAKLWPRVQRGDDKAVASWTRLLDREMRLTGVEKPHQVHVTTSNADTDALEVTKLLDQFFGTPQSAQGHVIQGEVVRRSEG